MSRWIWNTKIFGHSEKYQVDESHKKTGNMTIPETEEQYEYNEENTSA